MTIDHEGRPIATDEADSFSQQASDSNGESSDGATNAKEKAKAMTSAATDETTHVAHAAAAATKDVAGQAATQASAVAAQTKDQIHSVVGQAKDELKTQVGAKGEQAAVALRTLSGQLTALGQGRPDEAGQLSTLVGEAQEKVQSYATKLEQGGPQAIVDDLADFARRRPGLFLLAAGAAGFFVGRTVRAGTAASREGITSSSSPAVGSASFESATFGGQANGGTP